jgi:PEP-CTERM motif
MRREQRLLLMGVSVAVLSGVGGIANASLVASDQVSNNPPYSGYNDFNGLNGGYGFGPWNASNVSGSTGGDFMWNNVDLTTPGAGQGFDMYDNGTQGGGAVTDEFAAVRPFTGALSSGQDFSFEYQLNNGSNPTNGGPCNLGFSLEDSSGNVLFDFHTQGGAPGYYLTDATQTQALETNVPYNYQAIDTVSFTLDNAATGAYTFTVSGTPPSYNLTGPPLALQTFTGTISTGTGGVTQVAIYNNNGGQGSDLQFDDLSITNVPEPMSLALLGLAGVGTMIRRRR